MGTLSNIKVEPCNVSWNGVDLGFIDGDIELSTEEQTVDVVAHQEGTNVLDKIRTGKNVSLTTNLKEISVSQLNTIFGAGGSGVSGVAKVETITTVADSAGSLNNKVMFIYDKDGTGYCVWMNVNSAGTDPSIPGFTSVAVALATNATANDVADAVASALDALSAFAAPNPGANIVTVTHSSAGEVANASDAGNSGFTLAVTTPGTTESYAWGNAKDFTGMLSQAAQLILHPSALSAADETRDISFWKAYPMLGSIVKSGENPSTVSVEWAIFPDLSRSTDRLMVFGAHA